jgi:hypothetical protein
VAQKRPQQQAGYPQLVMQHKHGPGHLEAMTFEDALRNLVRNSPYLGISLLVHALVIIAMFTLKEQVALPDEANKIVATAEEIEEPLPPEPPPEEPELEEQEIVEEPVITEDLVTDDVEVVDSQDVDAAFDSTGLNDVIGVGGGGGGNFGGKLGKRRSIGKKAGTPYLKVVDDALRWLKAHQDPQGYWSCADFDQQCGKLGDDTYCTGRGSPMFDIGVTGLSLLAFMGAGNTDKDGKYADVVKNGLKYLSDVQDHDGNFANPDAPLHTYDHFIATLATLEAYALTKRHTYKKMATEALDYMYSLRNPGAAWRYADPADPDMIAHPNDTSVTGWAVMCLTLARDYGLDIDEQALEDAMAFLEEMTDAQGRTGYWEPGGGSSRKPGLELTWPISQSEAMTAVGVLCRIFIDPNLERPGNKEMIDKGVELISKLPIVWSDDPELVGRKDYYYWYYASYALFQVHDKHWKDWEKGFEQIAAAQVQEGEMQGSWDPTLDPWGGDGGRVYSTAILALTMEVYYRYDTVIGSH